MRPPAARSSSSMSKATAAARIAHALGVARASVRRVLDSGSAQVPAINRARTRRTLARADPGAVQPLQGHLVRVHEELHRTAPRSPIRRSPRSVAGTASATSRRARPVTTTSPPARRCSTTPRRTSPHRRRARRVQTASLVLCYSRMIFFQLYPRFTRFECKVFLADAIAYFDGACAICMIDNTHVVVAARHRRARWSRCRRWRPSPSASVLSSARTRRATPIARHASSALSAHRAELPRRRGIRRLDELNRQARATCEAWNAKFSQQAARQPPRALCRRSARTCGRCRCCVPRSISSITRIVDAEGYVHVDRIRYSVPYRLIGRALEVRETMDRVDLYDGPALRRLA